MMASTDTIEKLKRQFADSWSSSDDKENSDYDTATRLGSKSEPMSPIHFTWNEIQSADQSPSYRCSADDRLSGGSIFTLTPSSKSFGKEYPELVKIFVSKVAFMKALYIYSFCIDCGIHYSSCVASI